MSVQTWTYPPELLAALPAFGLKPTADTHPVFVRDALSELYRYEIRNLRQRLLDGHIAKPDYRAHVIALRKKYWPLALQPVHWEQICRGT